LCSTNELFGLLGFRQTTFTRAQWLLEMSTSSISSPSSLSSFNHVSGFKSDEKEGLLIQTLFIYASHWFLLLLLLFFLSFMYIFFRIAQVVCVLSDMLNVLVLVTQFFVSVQAEWLDELL
jgi:hypothetical protein